jgi:hypothetical protein
MESTPYELPLPGTANFSTKERFFEMRCFADQIWREENGFEDGALARIQNRKPKPVKTRVIRHTNLYRAL